MTRRSLLLALGFGLLLGAQILPRNNAFAKEEPLTPQFKYAGGTENLPAACDGNLEMNPEVLTFHCSSGKIEIPYSAISEMEYRSEVSDRIRKMKVKWVVRPDAVSAILKTKKNRFFTVVYLSEQTPHIMVLRVEPQAMRPYLAELDLRSDKRVQVETYDENQ
jgi:hypothetical protein